MNKFKKSQILMLSLLAVLLFVTPLIPSSLRPKYLYFLINLLIIALGAEAGLLSAAFSKPYIEEKKFNAVRSLTKPAPEELSSPDAAKVAPAAGVEKKAKALEKSASEKIVGPVLKVDKVKKCPSMPSLFFIGGGESNEVDYQLEEEEDGEDEEVGGISGQELFTKTENFIGNFYKQLKMQREESWKKIHGFCQKAF